MGLLIILYCRASDEPSFTPDGMFHVAKACTEDPVELELFVANLGMVNPCCIACGEDVLTFPVGLLLVLRLLGTGQYPGYTAKIFTITPLYTILLGKRCVRTHFERSIPLSTIVLLTRGRLGNS